ncbi:MAG: nuclear transport factor 2 family protein [Geodermatophilaceae bacterium]
MTGAAKDPRLLLKRLLAAVNGHDLDGLVACFDDDYVNVNPAHPQRGFRGREQVRRNWSQIFAGVPDVHARVLRSAVDGVTLWSEWEMTGARNDGAAFEMRGVFIFGVADGQAKWARMFLEPVEETSGDANALLARVAGDSTVSSHASAVRS